MTILGQHGWGKSRKIQRGLEEGLIQGVILSPRDESPRNLASFLTELARDYPGTERLVDPQFHIGTIPHPSVNNLQLYDHYQPSLTLASFSPERIRHFVQSTLDWQYGLDLTANLSPTVMVNDLSDRWAQVAQMLAQETIDQYDNEKPLLISLVIREDALRQRELVDDWLDNLTTMDVDGFYVVVRRVSESYRQEYDPDVLTSLLMLCYSLAELNQYRVFAGYTDMATLLLHAVGVTGTAAGWFGGLRQFTLRRFQENRGGRPPRTRYSSLPLLNSIYVSELDIVHEEGLMEEVLSDSPYDAIFGRDANPLNVPWPLEESSLHHWWVLDAIQQHVSEGRLQDRLDAAHASIAQAQALYADVGPLVDFSIETGPTHLDQWLAALNRFRGEL